MLRSNLCDYSDTYIHVKGTITITGERDNDTTKRLAERNKGVIFKNCAPFTKCISWENNTDIDTSQDIDIVMLIYNLLNIVIIIQKHLEVYGSITRMILMIT